MNTVRIGAVRKRPLWGLVDGSRRVDRPPLEKKDIGVMQGMPRGGGRRQQPHRLKVSEGLRHRSAKGDVRRLCEKAAVFHRR